MRRGRLAARFAATSLAVVAFATTPSSARALESSDSIASAQDRSFHVDSLPAGGVPRPPQPTSPLADASERPKGPVFVDFRLGWHRPESQYGELVLKSNDYGALGLSVGGYPRPWLEVKGDLDFHWAYFQGPPLAADPGTTRGTERSLFTSFAGITGRFSRAGPIGRPYAELGVGILSSTMSVDGTKYVGVWPLIFTVPFTESVHEGDPIARAGLGVTFPRKAGVEFGIGASYTSLAQRFGRLGQAKVGGLTCNVMLRSDPGRWYPRHRWGGRRK